MTLYMFKLLGENPPQYVLTKWSDNLAENGQVPSDTYYVHRNSCDCPAHIPFCKHLRVAKEVREKGWNLNGLVWDDQSNTFTRFMGVYTPQRSLSDAWPTEEGRSEEAQEAEPHGGGSD